MMIETFSVIGTLVVDDSCVRNCDEQQGGALLILLLWVQTTRGWKWHFPRGKPRPPNAEAELITTNNIPRVKFKLL